jgi:hypothetical protein
MAHQAASDASVKSVAAMSAAPLAHAARGTSGPHRHPAIRPYLHLGHLVRAAQVPDRLRMASADEKADALTHWLPAAGMFGLFLVQ